MTVYYVDDGGSNTSPFDTWAKAAPTLAALQTSIAGSTGTGGNVIYIGADSVSSGDGSGVTYTGPTTGGVCSIISATVGTTTYAKSATDQIAGTSTQSFFGNFALYGIQSKTVTSITINSGTSSSAEESFFFTEDCTFKPGSNSTLNINSNSSTGLGHSLHRNMTISAIQDSGAQSSKFLECRGGNVEINGLTLIDSSSHRTGSVIAMTGNSKGVAKISGADFSALTGIAAIVDRTNAYGSLVLHNCKTGASPVWMTGSPATPNTILITNSGNADAPEFLYNTGYFGTISSDTTNYRNSGASIEATSLSWKMVSNTKASVATPLLTPWMYGVISATGSKTFDVYVTQDGGAGDLTDAEVWLELEYLGTSNVAQSTFATDRVGPSGAFSGAAAQTDDATSTWAGTITETYMQKLSVTATVNEDGLYRARVALGKASQTLYVDPKVTVS